jgi:predicted house-cleaning noncanonical NTP pyrophosphatase (MazG superfamily)
MVVYKKLVRDKIPDIIKASGSTPITRILNNDEYLEALKNKLVEEASEARDNPVVEELADIKEVVMAISKVKGYTEVEIEQARLAKYEKRGGFDKRIFLESTDEK